MLKSIIIAISGIVIPFLIWAFVQSLWRKLFYGKNTNDDVLADRRSCGNCGCGTVCTKDNDKLKLNPSK